MSVREVIGTILEATGLAAAVACDVLLFWVSLPGAFALAAVILIAGSWAVQR